jgi:hypothetical protein
MVKLREDWRTFTFALTTTKPPFSALPVKRYEVPQVHFAMVPRMSWEIADLLEREEPKMEVHS